MLASEGISMKRNGIDIDKYLEYLRGEILAERISMGEIVSLQSLGDEGLIPEDDLLLRQWAGLEDSDAR